MAVDTVARLARSWFVATMIAIRGVCKYDDHGLQRSIAYVGDKSNNNINKSAHPGAAHPQFCTFR
jgi:hypothetical protein